MAAIRDINDLIKKQISEQVKAKLNTDLSKVNSASISDTQESPSVPGLIQISPQWVRGYYTLIRSQDIEQTPQLEPEEFKNYSGIINWQIVNSQAIIFNSLDEGSNNMFGLQLYSTTTKRLPMTFFTSGGILAIYTKSENDSSFIEKYIATSGGNSMVTLGLSANTWTTIIVTFYSAVQGAQIIFGADYTGITGWRPLDVIAPNVPTWAANPASFQIVQGDVKRGKVTLHWQKDISIDFGGNSIYREGYVNSGQSVIQPIPATLSDTFFRVASEKNKWMVVDKGSTLNAGDIITFDSTGASGTVVISRVRNNTPNLVHNSVFLNGANKWAYSVGALKTDANSLIGAHHWQLNETVANARRTFTSATIDIGGNGTLYYIGLLSSFDMMSNRHYGLGGYGSAPSDWDYSNGVSAILATREGLEPIMRVARTTALGSIRSMSNHLYFTTLATYQISCSGSFETPTEYKVLFRSSAGVALYTSPTLFATKGRNSVDVSAKPSASSVGYFEINTLATTGDVGTIDFNRFTIIPIQDRTDHSEFIEVQFYDSSHVACATARYTKDIAKDNRMSLSYLALGSTEIPSNCQYIKLAYVATTGDNSVYYNRRIYGMYVYDNFVSDIKFDVFATPYTILRVNGTIPSGTPNIYFTKSERIFDRPRQSDDGSIITWDDFDIDNNSTYTYKIDAYDNSPFKNRSAKTAGQTVSTGDTTAPKVPSNFSLTGYEGGVEYGWANPTANDFKAIRIYTDGDLNNLLFEQYGSAGATMRFTELVTAGPVSRWATAVDMWGNASGSIGATATALTSSSSDIGFQVLIKSGGTIVAQSNGDWYRTTVTASLLPDTGVAVASYFYSYHIIEVASINPRFTAWTTFNGSLTINNDYRHVLRVKIKDVNGNYSNVKELEINIDRQKPRIIDEHSFWSTQSRGGVGHNKLAWNNAQLTDKYDSFAGNNSTFDRSGITFGFLRRSAVTQLTGNPFFAYNQASGTMDGWSLVDTFNTVNASLYSDDAFYSQSCAKFTLTNTLLAPRFRSETFRANSGDKLFFMCRFKGSIANCTLSLQITNKSTTSYAAVSASLQTVATWQYVMGSLLVSTPTQYRLNVVAQDSSGASAGDYFLVDSLVCMRNVNMATIAKVPFNTNEYTDIDVEPWKGYLYDMQFKDEAGNYSNRLPFIYSIPVADHKDKYTNILDNSSFERTYRDSSDRLQAYGWENETYGSTPFVKTTPSNINVVKLGPAYNGSHYMELGDSIAGHKVYQNDIHVLPYTGKPRKYVYSGYARSGTGALESLIVVTVGRDNQTQAIKTKSHVLSNTIATVWERFSGTFEVASASITNLSFGAVSFGGTVQLDAFQLEEKNSLPPSGYYDTKSITADYLQGNLIRGHMIEADSIYGYQIRANTITATLIAANAITATQIAANSITASLMKLSNVDIYKVEKDGVYIASATRYASCRVCVVETPSSLSAYFETPYVFYWGGLRRETSTGDSYLGIGVKDFQFSNQGLVWGDNIFTSAPNEIRTFATITSLSMILSPTVQSNINKHAEGGNALLGLHPSGATLWVVMAVDNSRSTLSRGGANINPIIGVYSVDTELTGGDNAQYHGRKILATQYDFFDGIERYNCLAKSEHLGNGTFAILHNNFVNGSRADNIYLTIINKDGHLIAGPSLIVGSLHMGDTNQVRQTFMGRHPDTNNLVVGCYKTNTATLFYKVVSQSLTEVKALASTNAFSPYDTRTSNHGGDIICTSGSLIHWLFTGDASSTHGYCVTDFDGNIIVDPHIKWSLKDEVETRVWAFGQNVSTWGQPVIKEERGLLLPDGSIFYYMGVIPPKTNFNDDFVSSWINGLGTLPKYVQGLVIHKTVKYPFASISLESLFNRLR